jgi:predicted DNA-binding protein
MPVVQISDGVKDIIDHHLADGTASSEAGFIEEAVRRYAEILDDDADALIAAAKEGTEAIRRGEYSTISNTEDQAALWQRVWSRAAALADDVHAAGPDATDRTQASTRITG